MRTFIAIPVPDSVKQYADKVRQQIKQVGPDIKWVEYENYHLTLKFLGEVGKEQLDQVKSKLAVVAGSCPAFNLNLNGLGFFPNRTRPKVMWIGVKGEIDKALFLGERVDSYLFDLGFEVEKRRSFHLTLGRIRSERNQDELLRIAASLNHKLITPAFPVNNFCFMQSRLSQNGPQYEVVDSYQLNG